MTERFLNGEYNEYYNHREAVLDAIATNAREFVDTRAHAHMVSTIVRTAYQPVGDTRLDAADMQRFNLDTYGIELDLATATQRACQALERLQQQPNQDMMIARRALYRHFYQPVAMSNRGFRAGIAYEQADWQRADEMDDFNQTATVSRIALQSAELYHSAEHYVLRYCASDGSPIVRPLGLLVINGRPTDGALLEVRPGPNPDIAASAADMQDWLLSLAQFDED